MEYAKDVDVAASRITKRPCRGSMPLPPFTKTFSDLH